MKVSQRLYSFTVFGIVDENFVGRLETLRQHKNDVMEIGKGSECGLNLADFNDLRVGDTIEMYEEVTLPGTL